ALRAEADREVALPGAEDVRTGVRGLHDGVGEGAEARGCGDVVVEEDRVYSVVAQQGMRKTERHVDRRKVRRSAEGGMVDLDQGTPSESVPDVAPRDIGTLERHGDRRIDADCERQEVPPGEPFL